MLAQTEETDDLDETSRLRDAAWDEFVQEVRPSTFASVYGFLVGFHILC